MKAIVAGGGTGGHLMPALAIARQLRERGVDVLLVGALRGVEARVLPNKNFRYALLNAYPIYRKQFWRNIGWLWWAPRLVRAASRLLLDEQPDFVVGTGGYASGPIVRAAAKQGIPVFLQDQNATPGLASRLLARRARRVFVGYPEAAAKLGLPKERIVVSGNPIDPPHVVDTDALRSELGLGAGSSNPTIGILGGSQGAVAINEVVSAAIDRGLFDDVDLLWGVGRSSWERFRRHELRGRRVVREFWDPASNVFAIADVMISRAGAMSTAEICAWGLPSILVPLPSAAADHQMINARALEAAGASIVIPQHELTPDSLAAALTSLLDSPPRLSSMAAAAKSRGRPTAAAVIAEEILRVLDS